MDGFTGRIQEILRDPEALRDLTEHAAMLRQPEGAEAPAEQSAQAADLPFPDMGKLLAAGQLLGEQPPDANAALLAALKPYLSAERAARAQKAIRLLRLWQVVSVLRESGLLASLTE